MSKLKLPYILFESAPIGPIALEVLEKNHYPPVAIINDKSLSLEDQLQVIDEVKPTFILVVGFGAILKQEVLDTVAGQVLNIHPSLLPKLRGPAPIEGAILEGSSKTGVSLIRLSEAMDAGPIYIQTEVGLKGIETKPELYDQLSKVGANLLSENLSSIIEDHIKPVEQNETDATYTKLLSKADGMVRWDEPAKDIERRVRAYLEFPKSRAVIGDKEVILLEVRLAKSLEDGKLVIPCYKSFLEVLKLRAPNGREMSGDDFRRGYLK